jgi:hypothetical protein
LAAGRVPLTTAGSVAFTSFGSIGPGAWPGRVYSVRKIQIDVSLRRFTTHRIETLSRPLGTSAAICGRSESNANQGRKRKGGEKHFLFLNSSRINGELNGQGMFWDIEFVPLRTCDRGYVVGRNQSHEKSECQRSDRSRGINDYQREIQTKAYSRYLERKKR